jgi:uncharacterized protein (DUF1501 family)
MRSLSSLCPGPLARREFLRAGALALGGLTLPQLTAARAATAPRSDTSVILFWMWGGPSQLETWDPKPNAPSEYRGPFQPIATNVPGLDICEIFPRLSRMADKFAVVRSLHHEMAAHNDGSIEVLTGKTPARPDPTSLALSEHPDLGMVLSKVRGLAPGGMPNYVGIPTKPFMTRPNYLGVSHTAFETGNPAVETFRPPNLTLHGGINGSRLADRQGLWRQFDRLRQQLDGTEHRDGVDEFHGQAFDLLASSQVARAFDIEQESPKLRDQYGRTLWGQSCLLARRLAEAGVGLITIDALAPKQGLATYFSWDDHVNPANGWDLAPGMKLRATDMDPALATLIEDLHVRGLDQRVAVIAVGEFGRTPRLSHAGGLQGRDHWPQAMSALVAGGGWRLGQAIGATSPKAEYPAERPLTPQDLLATIYRHLGVNPQHEFLDHSGRPQPILPFGQPIAELV